MVPGEAGGLRKGTAGRGAPVFTHSDSQIPPLASRPPSPSAAPLRFEVTSCLCVSLSPRPGALGAGRETAEVAEAGLGGHSPRSSFSFTRKMANVCTRDESSTVTPLILLMGDTFRGKELKGSFTELPTPVLGEKKCQYLGL